MLKAFKKILIFELFLKVSEICEENLTLKDQVAALQEAVNVHEMESKANRETIMRLVSEVAKEQKKAEGYYQDVEKLNKVHNCMACMLVWFSNVFLKFQINFQ